VGGLEGLLEDILDRLRNGCSLKNHMYDAIDSCPRERGIVGGFLGPGVAIYDLPLRVAMMTIVLDVLVSGFSTIFRDCPDFQYSGLFSWFNEAVEVEKYVEREQVHGRNRSTRWIRHCYVSCMMPRLVLNGSPQGEARGHAALPHCELRISRVSHSIVDKYEIVKRQ
jgi:hypothetical protein